jgi:hypothetical protein
MEAASAVSLRGAKTEQLILGTDAGPTAAATDALWKVARRQHRTPRISALLTEVASAAALKAAEIQLLLAALAGAMVEAGAAKFVVKAPKAQQIFAADTAAVLDASTWKRTC